MDTNNFKHTQITQVTGHGGRGADDTSLLRQLNAIFTIVIFLTSVKFHILPCCKGCDSCRVFRGQQDPPSRSRWRSALRGYCSLIVCSHLSYQFSIVLGRIYLSTLHPELEPEQLCNRAGASLALLSSLVALPWCKHKDTLCTAQTALLLLRSNQSHRA